MFILGVLVGLLVAAIVLILEVWLQPRIILKTEQMLRTVTKQTGAVLLPKDDVELAQDEVRAQNAQKGNSTPLAEL